MMTFWLASCLLCVCKKVISKTGIKTIPPRLGGLQRKKISNASCPLGSNAASSWCGDGQIHRQSRAFQAPWSCSHTLSCSHRLPPQRRDVLSTCFSTQFSKFGATSFSSHLTFFSLTHVFYQPTSLSKRYLSVHLIMPGAELGPGDAEVNSFWPSRSSLSTKDKYTIIRR